MDDILESHRAATVRRCRGKDTVLAVQDTTMLDWSGLKGSTGGLADLGGGLGSRGIPAYVTLAVSASDRGLGVLGINAGFRAGDTVKAAESETRHWLDGLELAQRVGRACPGTRVISVCDREGDIWEMFEAQARDPEAGAGLLVRGSGGPVSWLLLSSDGEADLAGTGTVIGRYAGRWAIEEYFKTLKQGTRIGDRCLAFDAVTAWRVFDTRRAAKAGPGRPSVSSTGSKRPNKSGAVSG